MSILIYGHINDEEIVFLPKREAEYWAEFDNDYSTGITYGILYEKYPSIAFRIIENICGYLDLQIEFRDLKNLNAEEYFNLLFESLHEKYRNDESWVDLAGDDYDLNSKPDAKRFYEEELSEDERFPLIDEIFSSKTTDYWSMFEWADELPGMECWVPSEIEEKFAIIIDHSMNMAASVTSNSEDGVRFQYQVNDEKELIKAFRKHGYKCIRDDELIQNACG